MDFLGGRRYLLSFDTFSHCYAGQIQRRRATVRWGFIRRLVACYALWLMAFGGAGIFISVPLAEVISNRSTECRRDLQNLPAISESKSAYTSIQPQSLDMCLGYIKSIPPGIYRDFLRVVECRLLCIIGKTGAGMVSSII